MSPQCLPPSFSLIRLTLPEQMSFQDFQAGHHLGSWNETNLAILNLHVIPCLPPNLGSIRLTIREQTWLKIFKMATVAAILDTGTNHSAILNLYVALMPPIKFQLNPTYGLGGDVIRRFSRRPTWRPSWI